MIKEFEKALALINEGIICHMPGPAENKPEIVIHLKPYTYHHVSKVIWDEANPATEINVPTIFNNDRSSFKLILCTGSIIFKMEEKPPYYNGLLSFKPLP